MYQWLAQSLGNVSVNRKLGLGFGLVLLLTLAITLVGWHGMDSIIDRGDKLGNISVVQQYTQELRRCMFIAIVLIPKRNAGDQSAEREPTKRTLRARPLGEGFF